MTMRKKKSGRNHPSMVDNIMDGVCGMLLQDAESEDYDDYSFGETVFTWWTTKKQTTRKRNSDGPIESSLHFKREQEARGKNGGHKSKYAREAMKPKTTMSVGSSTPSMREQEARGNYGGRSSKYARETMKPKTTMSGHRRIEAKAPNKPTRTGHSRIEAKAPMYRYEPDHDKYYKPKSHKVKAFYRKLWKKIGGNRSFEKEYDDREDSPQERSSRRYDDFSRSFDTEYDDRDDLHHERSSRRYDDYSIEESREPLSLRHSSHSRRNHNDHRRHSRQCGRRDIPPRRPMKTIKRHIRMR